MRKGRAEFLKDCIKISEDGFLLTKAKIIAGGRNPPAVGSMLLSCVDYGQLTVKLGNDHKTKVYAVTEKGIMDVKDWKNGAAFSSIKNKKGLIYRVLKTIKENQPVREAEIKKILCEKSDLRIYIKKLYGLGFLERTDPSKRPIKYSANDKALNNSGIELD